MMVLLPFIGTDQPSWIAEDKPETDKPEEGRSPEGRKSFKTGRDAQEQAEDLEKAQDEAESTGN